ncbi:hypothetical protein FB45DRAFT_522156 [Roridomyces roridus]|uniref:Uncharacterized protein n=1 Tax=Roridomyces roridus TaxID=1738132 RepID=A0AAD7BXG6_9AGAR|nr:hypothetical protein FB45DRAFT_522156 [Roridomyces roridus]
MSSFSNQSQQAQDASSSAEQTNTNLPAFSDQAQNFSLAFMPPTPNHAAPNHATPNDYAQFQSGLAAPTAGAPHAQQYPLLFPYPPVHQPALGPVEPSAGDGWVVANIAGLVGLYEARILPRIVSQPGVTVTNGAPDWYRQAVPEPVPSAYRASAAPPIPAPQQAILPSSSAGPSDLKRQRPSEPDAPRSKKRKTNKAKADVDVDRPYQVLQFRVDVQSQPEPAAVAAQVPAGAPFTPSASTSTSFTFNAPPQAPVYPGPATQRPVPRRVGAPRRATGTAQVPVAQELAASESSSGQIAHSASAVQTVAVAAVQPRPAQVPAAQGLAASTFSAPNASASTEAGAGSTAATLHNITNAVPPSPRVIQRVGSLSGLRASSSSSSGNRDQNLPEQGTTSSGVSVADAVDAVQKAGPSSGAASGATQGDAQVPTQTDKAEESQASATVDDSQLSYDELMNYLDSLLPRSS